VPSLLRRYLCKQSMQPTPASYLAAKRLQFFLEHKPYMGKNNRKRIAARIPIIQEQELKTKRIPDKALLPQSNYRTQGARHWR
jgi:hypothetical protein